MFFRLYLSSNITQLSLPNMRIASSVVLGLMLTSISAGVAAQDFEVAPVRLDFNAEPGKTKLRLLM